MKRKIIKQKDSYTVTLPKKWIKDKGLEGKEEIEVDEVEGKLILSTEAKGDKNSVNLDISHELMTTIRTMLANAYRAGYDVLRIKFKTQKQLNLINETVSNMLLGFEILETKENLCIVESVAEPNTDDFNSIFIKILQIVSIHLDNTIEYTKKGEVDLKKNKELAQKAIEYDNFCRRAISKKRIAESKAIFYWAFFSTIIHVDRKIYQFNKDLEKTDIKASKELTSLLENAKEFFNLLKETYLKRDLKLIGEIHVKEHRLIYEKGYALLKKRPQESILLYSILDMIRNTHLSTSPLMGILIR